MDAPMDFRVEVETEVGKGLEWTIMVAIVQEVLQ